MIATREVVLLTMHGKTVVLLKNVDIPAHYTSEGEAIAGSESQEG